MTPILISPAVSDAARITQLQNDPRRSSLSIGKASISNKRTMDADTPKAPAPRKMRVAKTAEDAAAQAVRIYYIQG